MTQSKLLQIAQKLEILPLSLSLDEPSLIGSYNGWTVQMRTIDFEQVEVSLHRLVMQGELGTLPLYANLVFEVEDLDHKEGLAYAKQQLAMFTNWVPNNATP